jgi:hypothetical protein
MTSKVLLCTTFALTFGTALVAAAQTAAPMASASGASAMATPASGAKVKRKARLTGGPGYVSESGATPAASAASSGTGKKRARVTGGPGGTAGTPGS